MWSCVGAYRQAFAGDHSRRLQLPPASRALLRSFSGTRWSLNPLAVALTNFLRSQHQPRPVPSRNGEFELSRPPRHTPAVDGDSGPPFPLG